MGISTNYGIDPNLTLKAPPAIPQTSEPRPLPSLLRYVDNHLVRSKYMHDKPPDRYARCGVCHYVYNKAPTATVFLPLSPCGCWIHYRCFIWRATRNEANHDCCPLCKTKLYEWEGITAITLATRTGLEMEDVKYLAPQRYTDGDTGQLVYSHLSEYYAECTHIEAVINVQFYTWLHNPSTFADGSPELNKCYYGVLEALDQSSRVKSKWLSWHTQVGYYLYGMLVAIMMRRYLLEKQPGIRNTEAWKAFEEGRLALQGKILGEVGDPAEGVPSDASILANVNSRAV
jgi:hypothetical protein